MNDKLKTKSDFYEQEIIFMSKIFGIIGNFQKNCWKEKYLILKAK